MDGGTVNSMTVAISQLAVPRYHRQIPQGQSVFIIAEVRDVALVSTLLDPTSVPVVSIFDPDEVALVTDVPMVQISTGKYGYVFQTTTDHDAGVYTATVTVVNGAEVARVEKVVVFKIIRTTTLVSFTYLAIQDEDNVVWYWFVGSDNTLWTSLTVPIVVGKQAVPWPLAIVPHWLEIDNAAAELRYVYPSVAGEPTVNAVQPAVGTGMVGSPMLAGVAGGIFTISLNISDEIILATM